MAGCGGDEELLLDETSTFAEDTLVFDHPAGLVETIAGADLARFCFEEGLAARYPRCIDFAVVGEPDSRDRRLRRAWRPSGEHRGERRRRFGIRGRVVGAADHHHPSLGQRLIVASSGRSEPASVAREPPNHP